MTSFEYDYQNSRLSKCLAESFSFFFLLIDSFDFLAFLISLHLSKKAKTKGILIESNDNNGVKIAY